MNVHTHVYTHTPHTTHTTHTHPYIIPEGLKLQCGIHDVPDLVEEPSVNLGHVVQLVHIVASRV